MNRLLAAIAALVFLATGCATRVHLARAARVHPLDVRTLSEVEIWFYAFCLICAIVAFWYALRPVCPECGSWSITPGQPAEFGRYNTARPVWEQDNNGRRVKRHLNVTVAEMRQHFVCRNCPHEWTIKFERDK